MTALNPRAVAARMKGQMANHPKSQFVRLTRAEAETLVRFVQTIEDEGPEAGER